ncbi:MAG: hypothetical protein A2Y45_07130 [Tenericutes bacterium GWC2_34_14]|nr:MAG: hypothetical protein A2Y45_07130 [Tenericutes bacterium GWC2_34_14]OHE33360.1 MAG: hypothetical protein A2012_10210 [Tenericutes bacterium GWE2_34_108]OHE36661.1 MAG: hypothetical protein A2Y46_08485 [Tenericutes bacterium GWF1_35_14]OHE38260.1 MAG: hypothetical protein A2Y44_10180 [Tenericutes bacterium GWF2_35_184]OHE44967.1 MAG: hypothetical protein A2221_05090 [Tenericutes bacterium RIFOXYA2_FULL_36_32]OHE45415.1 MAG: hypothetical protein A3K26_07670 [Tenericutes bacterium RIFOXYA1
MDTEIKDWIKKIKAIHLPRWNELPELALYLDQVLEYVNGTLSDVFVNRTEANDKVLTSSMINNYVKNNIMPPPEKKRYGRDHIAFIITITVLKQVASLNDVSQGIKHLTAVLGKVEAFNQFITFLENALKSSTLELQQKVDHTHFQTPVSMDLLPLKTATIAFASISMSQYLLKEIAQNQKEKNS